MGLLLLCVVTQAAMRGPLTVVASNAAGKWAAWTYNWTNGASYTLQTPYEMKAADGTKLGYLNNLVCSMDHDPFLNLNFSVTAVGTANFFFDTGELVFPVINEPAGFATAAATITANETAATLTGLFAGGKAYEATYNGGTVFADLISTFGTPPFSSNTQNERVPPPPGSSDFTPIPVPVSSMRAQWSFQLTDGDQASGTSRFQIEPIPDAGTLTLALGGAVPLIGGLVARRRRRA